MLERKLSFAETDFADESKLYSMKQFIDQFDQNFIIAANLEHKIFLTNETTAKWVGFSSAVKMMQQRISCDQYKCKVAEIADVLYKENNLLLQHKESREYISCGIFADTKNYLLYGHKYPIIDDNQKTIGFILNMAKVVNSPVINLAFCLQNMDLRYQRKSSLNQFSYTVVDKVPEFNISKRKMECLFYILRGKSANDIAKILHRSRRTIEAHTEELKHLLNCSTKPELIEKSIDMGMLNYVPKHFI